MREYIKLIQQGYDDKYYTEDPKRFNLMFSFVATFVIRLYGKNYILDKVKNNPGTSIWDHISSSDIAYTILIVVNGSERWEQEYEKNKLPEEEQAKFWEARKKIQGKFTFREGNRAELFGHGFSNDGLRLYKTMWKHWQGIFRNKELYDIMMTAWQVWAEENEFAQQYKEKKRSVSTKKTVLEDSDNEGDDDEFADLYVLSGDSNFKSDHPWAASTTNHGSNYDDELEDESGSEDGDDEGDMTHEQVNALCRKKREMIAYSNSSDEEEEESPPIKPKKKKAKHQKKPSLKRRISTSPV